MRFKVLLSLATLLIAATLAHAGGPKSDEYPLRVHVFNHSGHSHYWHRMLQFSEGEGRANIFESSQPTAFDFNFHCPVRLMNNPGFETYSARWKKPGRELAILIPEIGKPESWLKCDLDVRMKTGIAYVKHEGNLTEEPSDQFVQWMQKHDYDPEHGKNEPVKLSPQDIPKPEPEQNDDEITKPIAPPADPASTPTSAPTDTTQPSPQPQQNPK
jgi:hypothetical protein